MGRRIQGLLFHHLDSITLIFKVLFSHSVVSDSLQPPRTAACQASLSFTISRTLLKLMSIESVLSLNNYSSRKSLKSLQMVPAAMKLKDARSLEEMTNLDMCIKKQRHFFVYKGPHSQSFGFSNSHVWIWELDHKKSWAPKNWCFWIVVLENSWESLGLQRIQPVHPKGNQSWIFIGRTDVEAKIPILCPPDMKNWLNGKDPDSGKDWRWEEKGTTEDEIVGWHHWLSGNEFE